MITEVTYIEETPNMNYVIELGGEDHDFRKKFVEILKREFTDQLGSYLLHIKLDEPRAAAEVVHKLKYKFTMLSMKRAFYFAEGYEEHLHVGDMTLDDDFKKILKTVKEYLLTL